jgi:hypothetical protein
VAPRERERKREREREAKKKTPPKAIDSKKDRQNKAQLFPILSGRRGTCHEMIIAFKINAAILTPSVAFLSSLPSSLLS